MAFTVYRAARKHGNPQVTYHPSHRATGQVIFAGTDPQILSPNGIFWIEQIITGTGVTVIVADGGDGTGAGSTALFTTGSVECEWSPIRCDHGVIITGTVLLLKGFIQEDVISN